VCNNTLRVSINGTHDISVKCVPEHDEEDTNVIVRLKPPVSRSQAQKTQLCITYIGDAAVEVTHTTIFCAMLMPSIEAVRKHVVYRGQGELEYECYETHQLRLNQSNEITHVYVSVFNAQTSAAVTAPLKLQTRIDMKLHWLPNECRMMPLRWFPPDLDPAEHGLRVDTRSVPQRTPLWFKLRGDVSGSKTVRYTGFFVTDGPDKGFDNIAKARMRLGTLSEDKAMLSYLHVYPHRTFLEVGWCPLASGPTGWGASPDGIIEDTLFGWHCVPDYIKMQYSEEEQARMDVRYGACEFKTSRLKEGMESYFYPQLYMEMMALNTVWCDVVRYKPERVWNDANGNYQYMDRGSVFRVYRDRTIEHQLIKLWKHAHNNAHALWKTIAEDEYVQMRDTFKRFAATAAPEPVTIDASQDNVLAERLARYDTYQYKMQQRMCESTVMQVNSDSFEFVTANALEIQMQQHTLSASELSKRVVSQIEQYTIILKSLF
jgi:hypothetical protein